MKLLVLIAVFAATVLVGCTDQRVASLESQVVDLSKERDAAIAQTDELKTEVQSLKEGMEEVLAELRKPTPTPLPTSTPMPTATPQPTATPLPPTPTVTLTPTITLTPTSSTPAGLVAWLEWYDRYLDLWDEFLERHNALVDKVHTSGEQPRDFLDEYRDLKEFFRQGVYDYLLGGILDVPEARPIVSSMSKCVEQRYKELDVYIRHLETGDRALFEQAEALRIEANALSDEIHWAVRDLKAKYGLD